MTTADFDAAAVGLLKGADPELVTHILAEETRQTDHLELIASENYCSPAIRAAAGSRLTNKYAEGYPGRRYYGGCIHIDGVEALAIDRARQLFDATYANVQPHSGSQANASSLLGLIPLRSRVLGMALDQGGHLTHGSSVNFSGKLYEMAHYGVTASYDIDYDEMQRKALDFKPALIIGGFSAFPGIADWARMREIADQCGALFMVDMAHVAGLVAAGEYPSPIPHAHVVTTTTHKTLRGPRGGLILSGSRDEKILKRLQSGLFPGTQGGPLPHIIAAKAICFKEAATPSFRDYQRHVLDNARTLAAALGHHGFNVITGSTHNHMVLVDLKDKDFSGRDAEEWLDNAGITLNRNTIANDPRPPTQGSGLRLGSPALTTRGMGADEMNAIALWIASVISHRGTNAKEIGQEVAALCHRFPLP